MHQLRYTGSGAMSKRTRSPANLNFKYPTHQHPLQCHAVRTEQSVRDQQLAASIHKTMHFLDDSVCQQLNIVYDQCCTELALPLSLNLLGLAKQKEILD